MKKFDTEKLKTAFKGSSLEHKNFFVLVNRIVVVTMGAVLTLAG
jgi:hypothetical protein